MCPRLQFQKGRHKYARLKLRLRCSRICNFHKAIHRWTTTKYILHVAARCIHIYVMYWNWCVSFRLNVLNNTKNSTITIASNYNLVFVQQITVIKSHLQKINANLPSHFEIYKYFFKSLNELQLVPKFMYTCVEKLDDSLELNGKRAFFAGKQLVSRVSKKLATTRISKFVKYHSV